MVCCRWIGGAYASCSYACKKKTRTFSRYQDYFFTTQKKIDAHISSHYSWVSQWVACPIMPLEADLTSAVRFGFQVLITVIMSLWHYVKNRPSRIVTTGGFLALPLCYVAKIFDIPIDLYEVNSTPGRAALVIGQWAQNVYVTFQSCIKFFPKRCSLVPYPLRFEQKDRLIDKSELISFINNELENKNKLFDSHRKTILIVCGSQGSVYVNDLFKEWLREQHGPFIQVVHQVGFSDKTDWGVFYDKHRIPALVFSYREDIGKLYGLADVVICRGGAGTLFEVEFFKKKCIVIPLECPYTSHQVDNAVQMAKCSNFFVVQRQQGLRQGVCGLNKNLTGLL